MNRRVFLSIPIPVISTALSGCMSNDDAENDSPNDISNRQNSNNENGPVAPEEAVKHYDNAIELLVENADSFDTVRQQMILGQEDIDFSVTTITSRTSEARSQLDMAALEDEGKLENEINLLRDVASYQETLANYNEEYLKLTRLTNSGLDHYIEEEYQSAIDTLQSAQQQIEPTRSALEDVNKELNEVLDATNNAETDGNFRERMLMAEDDHAEIREELNWLEKVIPARIGEIRGEQALSLATDAFEEERYGTARSMYSDAENHYVSAQTQLEGLNIRTDTYYLENLVVDSDRLVCEYGFLADASDEMAQASQALQNDNSEQADRHLENANSEISSMDTC